MGFLSLWPLAFLVLVPVIILLYILKQEAKTYSFSSTMLWQQVYRNMEATKPWEKLRKNILMFLQILTVLLFILALMNPWIRDAGETPQALILVVDSSASMDTVYADDMTRLEYAKELAVDYVDKLAGGTPVYVVDCNQTAVLLISGSTDKLEIKNRIRGISQTSYAGTAANSMGIVQSCVSLAAEAQVIFLTDTLFDIGDLNAKVVSLYSEQSNVAVDTVSAAASDDQTLVLVNVTGYLGAEEEKAGEINLYAISKDGSEKLMDIGKYSLKGSQSQAVYFTLQNEALEGVTAFCARLNESDALAGDNEAYGVLDSIAERKVLLMTKSNLFVEKAFGVLGHTVLYRTSETALPADADYDLYIFDGMVPDTMPQSGSFLFINCEWENVFENCGKVSGVRLTVVDNSMTQALAGQKIGVNASLQYTLPVWADQWLRTPEGECAGFYGSYDGHLLAAMGFDVHETDFVLQAYFPVLISDMADYLLDSGLAEEDSVFVGESVQLYASGSGENFVIQAPDGDRTELASTEASGYYYPTSKIGVYLLSQKLNGEEKMQGLAVNFPTTTESSVVAVSDMDQAVEAESTVGGMKELRSYLLLFLLFLLVAEWILYVRMT